MLRMCLCRCLNLANHMTIVAVIMYPSVLASFSKQFLPAWGTNLSERSTNGCASAIAWMHDVSNMALSHKKTVPDLKPGHLPLWHAPLEKEKVKILVTPAYKMHYDIYCQIPLRMKANFSSYELTPPDDELDFDCELDVPSDDEDPDDEDSEELLEELEDGECFLCFLGWGLQSSGNSSGSINRWRDCIRTYSIFSQVTMHP